MHVNSLSIERGAQESDVRVYSRNFPIELRFAKGATLCDKSGREYLDFFAGAGALNYGHNHPALKNQVIKYLQSDRIVHSLDMYTEARSEFMNTLYDLVLYPRNMDHIMQFTGPTGTNSVEAALKLARKVTGRQNVVAFTGAFHGVSLGALAVTASTDKRQSSQTNLNGVIRMPFHGYFGGNDELELQWLTNMLTGPNCGTEPPAAFIFECVQGEGGLNVASSKWAQGIASLAKKLGALVIVDEIQTGCGRTGDFFGFEALGITPDIICMSKSLSGLGIPLSIILLRPHLDVWEPGEHNGTFRGVNLAFVSGTEALKLWNSDSFQRCLRNNIEEIGIRLERIATEAGANICSVRGRGILIGLAFKKATVAKTVQKIAYREGLFLENCGADDEVCKVSPPLNISQAELNSGLNILHNAVKEACDKLAGQAEEIGE